MDINSIIEKLHYCRASLEAHLKVKKPDQCLIEIYQDKINELEAEIVVHELMVELEFIHELPSYCTTDSFDVVMMLNRNHRVVKVDHVWNWLKFKSTWIIEFYFITK